MKMYLLHKGRILLGKGTGSPWERSSRGLKTGEEAVPNYSDHEDYTRGKTWSVMKYFPRVQPRTGIFMCYLLIHKLKWGSD